MSAASKQPDQTRSKIGRLSFEDRMAFNRMVRDGYKSSVLIKWLSDHSVPEVNAQNISKYRKSAHYRRWLDEQKDLEREREDTESAMRLAEALGGSASEKIKSILAGKLYLFGRGIEEPSDLKHFVSAFNSVTNAEDLQLRRRLADQKDEQIDLAKKRFRRDTCEMFLKWRADQRASEIADDPGLGSDEKTDMLGKLMFPEDW